MTDYTSLNIRTSELVYMPSEDTELAERLLAGYLGTVKRRRRGLAVLDMGTGTGALGIAAAMDKKVGRVLFADKDDNALSLAKENILSNKRVLHAECSLVKTDLFSGIGVAERFDIIAFNPPYLPSEGGKSPLEGAWDGGETGVEVTAAFLEEAAGHLNDGGAILIVTSSFADEERVYSLAKRLGLSVCLKKSIHVFFEDITATVLVCYHGNTSGHVAGVLSDEYSAETGDREGETAAIAGETP